MAMVMVGGCMVETDLLGRHGLLRRLVQLLNRLLVKAQVLLASNEDDGKALAEVQNLGDPLWVHVSLGAVMAMTRLEGGTFSWTLSSESGESTAKQMRITCESGYERGRRRS